MYQKDYLLFMIEQFAYFLDRLSKAQEEEGSVLDHSLILYGSSNSTTHTNLNYPLLLAGGKSMGFQHNQFLQYGKEVPLANLYLTMLHRLGVEVE